MPPFWDDAVKFQIPALAEAEQPTGNFIQPRLDAVAEAPLETLAGLVEGRHIGILGHWNEVCRRVSACRYPSAVGLLTMLTRGALTASRLGRCFSQRMACTLQRTLELTVMTVLVHGLGVRELAVVLVVGVTVLGGGAGWVAGRLLHRTWSGQLLDAVQGAVGAALCVEVFALTGPLPSGRGELAVLAVLGAWVAVGTSHATSALMRYAGLAGGSRKR